MRRIRQSHSFQLHSKEMDFNYPYAYRSNAFDETEEQEAIDFSSTPITFTTNNNITFFSIIPIDSFDDFNFSGNEKIQSENVRITFLSSEEVSILIPTVEKRTVVKNLVLML